MGKPRKVFIIAGEASGDLLGAGLMRSLKHLGSDSFEFQGIGGADMTREGIKTLFPMEELSVMGLSEVLPRLFNIFARIRQTVDKICEEKPDMLITVDIPDFSFRVARAVRKRLGDKIKIVHYVAPTVWAWREGRAKKVAKFLDHLLCMLPFEPPYFEKEGLSATFVGHPVVEREYPIQPGFLHRHGISKDAKILSVLPGSRDVELKYLLKPFVSTVELLSRQHNSLHVVVPTFERYADRISQAFAGTNVPFTIVTSNEEKWGAFEHSSAALAASGTVLLELAKSGVPLVAAYKMSALNFAIISRLIKVRYAAMLNILENQMIIPEYIQQNCQPALIAEKLSEYLINQAEVESVLKQYDSAFKKMGPPKGFASANDCAAQTVVKILEE